jgi:DNA-3-methyladenine glycosylase
MFMRKVLDKTFFERPTLEVAESLLGKFLIKRYRGVEKAYMITEVEAYDGFEDKASHAHKGKTERNEVMFGEAGYWYVYLVYGMHNMLNIVTGEKEYPAAVLIRGVEYNGKRIDGPGKITKMLKIDRSFNKKKMEKKTGLWIEDRGVKIKKSDIKKTPRIGVDYSGSCSKKLYRFVLVK